MCCKPTHSDLWMAHSVHTCCQSRDLHCLGESGHFHIIVTHSDTLKRWTAVSRQPWGDHPLGWVGPLFSQHLFFLLKGPRVSPGFGSMVRYTSRDDFLGSISQNQSEVTEHRAAISSPPCLKRFARVLLSDMMTHGVATDSWADGSWSAPCSLWWVQAVCGCTS